MRRLLHYYRVLAAVAAVTTLSLVAVACGASSKAQEAAEVTPPPPISIEIAETDDGFVPTAITVARGQLVRITFINKGKVIHNLRVAGGPQFAMAGDVVLGDPVVAVGESATKEWRAPSQAGRRQFRCDVHPNHTGVITIR